jgi:hypothetical protein
MNLTDSTGSEATHTITRTYFGGRAVSVPPGSAPPAALMHTWGIMRRLRARARIVQQQLQMRHGILGVSPVDALPSGDTPRPDLWHGRECTHANMDGLTADMSRAVGVLERADSSFLGSAWLSQLGGWARGVVLGASFQQTISTATVQGWGPATRDSS